MKADVSTMTRICDRLHICSKFIGGLLENADAMLTAQGEELGSWHSSQFRSHASRDATALKHLESSHELDFPGGVGRTFAQSRRQFRRHLDIYGRHDVPSIAHVGGPMTEVYPTQAASSCPSAANSIGHHDAADSGPVDGFELGCQIA